MTGEVLWVDRFGNVQLNVDPDEICCSWTTRCVLRLGDQTRTRRPGHARYADLRSGQIGLVVDSYGLVSIALDRRSAAEELRIGSGDAVTIEAPPSEAASPCAGTPSLLAAAAGR